MSTPTIRTNSGYGWRPQLPDRRDLRLIRPRATAAAIPSSADLRHSMPPVYDQGDLGSCTANATCAALEYNVIKQGQHDFTPSRLFVYYNTRLIEGTIATDAGAECRDAIKAAAAWGACSEQSDWPYVEAKFSARPRTTATRPLASTRSPATWRWAEWMAPRSTTCATCWPAASPSSSA